VPPHLGVPVHAPAPQLSEPAKTQRLPSEHAAPFEATGFEHWPLA
jgi:hypothetical protein